MHGWLNYIFSKTENHEDCFVCVNVILAFAAQVEHDGDYMFDHVNRENHKLNYCQSVYEKKNRTSDLMQGNTIYTKIQKKGCSETDFLHPAATSAICNKYCIKLKTHGVPVCFYRSQ